MRHFVVVGILVILMAVLTYVGLVNAGLMPVQASAQSVPIDRMWDEQVIAMSFLFALIVVQIPIPNDEVDADWLTQPRQWTIGSLQRFILLIGPISSIFDYTTFFIMLYVFNAWNNPALFHTGWFVESLFTQTLIIHVIRTNKIPFIESRASLPLILTSLGIVTFGAWLQFLRLPKHWDSSRYRHCTGACLQLCWCVTWH